MPSREPINLFVYGTLMDPQRVAALTAKQFARVEATLVGFGRIESDLGYPFILPSPGAVVHGILLIDIDPVSLYRLDAYEAEGDLYRRQSVEVLVADKSVPAMTYVGHAICASARQAPRQQDGTPASTGFCDATTHARALCASSFNEH
jgi:gamma-glutamylcyclotransferase (GGCT)/AIG2-like uncharacterized protein YtfP